MLARIRHISHKRRGTVVQSEHIAEMQSISIGRATDQDMFLPDTGVSYQHARLSLSPDGSVGISSQSRTGFYLNGRYVQSGAIHKSGEVLIGPYRIRINTGIKIKHGDEFIKVDITYERIAEDVIQVQSDKFLVLKLEDTWLSRRLGAWIGIVLVLVLFLVMPVAGYINTDVGNYLRDARILPGEGVWNSGEISLSHKHFANDCRTCHVNAFESVQDSTCLECHSIITAHTDNKEYAQPVLDKNRCSDCHKEHNGTEFLVRQDQALCNDCHSELNKLAKTGFANISDFEIDHTEFRPTFFVKDDTASINSLIEKRTSLGDRKKKQANGLKFSHVIHLDYKGLSYSGGNRVLICEDCHRTDGVNVNISPVSMEKHCQGCHVLRFDKNSPGRQLPHINPDEIGNILEEYYALQALQQATGSKGAALAWARGKAAALKQAAKSSTACGKCHSITDENDSPQAWQVDKVITSHRWFTKAEFNHQSHRATLCTECHQANISTKSEDILMPGIKVCRECHGGESSSNKLVSGCVMCHKYHIPGGAVVSISSRNIRGHKE